MKSTFTPIAVLALLLLPAAMQAQNGCVNSPENPTALLALIGSAAAAIPALKRRRAARNRTRGRS